MRWVCCVRTTYFEPLVHALGMELVTAGQYTKGLPDLKVAHANNASRLIVFGAVSRISGKTKGELIFTSLLQFTLRNGLEFYE